MIEQYTAAAFAVLELGYDARKAPGRRHKQEKHERRHIQGQKRIKLLLPGSSGSGHAHAALLTGGGKQEQDRKKIITICDHAEAGGDVGDEIARGSLACATCTLRRRRRDGLRK